MKKLYIYLSVLLVSIALLILISWRIFKERQLKKTELAIGNDLLLKKKLIVFKQIQQNINIWIIFGVIATMLLNLIVLGALQMKDKKYIENVSGELTKLEKQVDELSKVQDEFFELSIYNYPEEGIGLSDIDWKGLLKQITPEERFSYEEKIGRDLTPYFGRTVSVITNNIPLQYLTLTIYIEVNNRQQLPKIQKNIEVYLKEVQGINLLNQANIQIFDTNSEIMISDEVFLRTDSGELELLEKSEDDVEQENENKTEVQEKEEQKGEVKTNG
ncbi:hypothetical protein D932_02070 [Enterococcus casseliflavus 14-MB-W-14]|uniref:hypothetical protein n=1 Tax=Enterococcus casseliflavus TaxID=37734 RepID=UPI0003547C68|nr:hypothetical protein [Enterococcus casseliflavus]EPH63153.1 hypothetical protein D932_02070 [Enterococcus casseliflavus 14-MB-W-14]NKD39806.1 hypothetical protein [Enterococcus casseliflavus]